MSEEWFEGKCRWFKEDRGYGFVRKDDGTDVFCHVRDLARDPAGHRYAALAVGQKVRFVLGRAATNNRTCAQRVQLLDPVISPVREEYRPDPERDDHLAHMELAQTAFMRRPSP
jgi:cold shock CspA family protein